jgi:hypothetical protein
MRPLTAWLEHNHGMDDEKTRPAKLELQPMDWRNPPSENTAQTAIPLAAVAAVYMTTTLEAHDRSAAATRRRRAPSDVRSFQPDRVSHSIARAHWGRVKISHTLINSSISCHEERIPASVEFPLPGRTEKNLCMWIRPVRHFTGKYTPRNA